MSVYGYDKNKCEHEVYTTEEVDTQIYNANASLHNTIETERNLALDDYKLKGDYAVISGNVTVPAGSGDDGFAETGYDYIEFPEGFTKDNCVILTQGTKNNSSTNGYCYGYTPETMNVFAMGSGCFHMRTILGNEDNKIKIEIDNYYVDEIVVSYKIVLMKI